MGCVSREIKSSQPAVVTAGWLREVKSAFQAGFCRVFRHFAQMYMRFGVPDSVTFMRCTLTFQRRFVCRMEWLTLFPNCGPLPHTSHLAIGYPPNAQCLNKRMTEPRRLGHIVSYSSTKGCFAQTRIGRVFIGRPVLEEERTA
jgi:hypothetical protein